MNEFFEKFQHGIQIWKQGNAWATGFSGEELLEIAIRATYRGGIFIHAFDDLVFQESIKKGKFPFNSDLPPC